MTLRNEKLEELIRKLAALFIQVESNRTSLITVTRCSISPDSKRAMVLVTVLPDTEEEKAVQFLKRKRSDFRNYVKSHARIRAIPLVDFEIDIGEKTRQKIDELPRNS